MNAVGTIPSYQLPSGLFISSITTSNKTVNVTHYQASGSLAIVSHCLSVSCGTAAITSLITNGQKSSTEHLPPWYQFFEPVLPVSEADVSPYGIQFQTMAQIGNGNSTVWLTHEDIKLMNLDIEPSRKITRGMVCCAHSSGTWFFKAALDSAVLSRLHEQLTEEL